MKTFSCACGVRLFFQNVRCTGCGRETGWCPRCERIVALEPVAPDRYRCARRSCGAELTKCRNYADHGVCNWMVALDPGAPAPPLCACCRYTEVIPDLTIDGHRERWAELEDAKRRLLYTLDLVGLPYGTADDGFSLPLSFAFMTDAVPENGLWRSVSSERTVRTGHLGGRITIDVKEADDVERERLRVDLSESHRTVVGHFRHEIGHYYWELLVRGAREDSCRRIFGDHEEPYDLALDRYYRTGAPRDWETSYLSAYASMHPWEDFAECFAFYLTTVSGLDTAAHWGLVAAPEPGSPLETRLEVYVDLGVAINEVNRETGLKDLVPQVVTPAVRDKLTYVDEVVSEAVRQTPARL